jgi:integrase
MPKWVRRPPQARLHKPSGQARVRIDGPEIYLGKFGSAEARRRYAEVLADWAARRDSGVPMAPAAPVTVSIAVFRFWTWAQGHYVQGDGSPTREADNLRDALRPLRRMFGDTPLAELGPSKLYDYQAALVAEGLARTTINVRVGKVRRFVRWCVGRELVSPTVLTALTAVEPVRAGRGAREAPKRRPVEWATVEKTLPHLSEMLRALVLALWHTGARVGEIVTLTTGSIDQSGDVWRAHLDRHKNAHRGQDRVLLFGPEAQAVLRPWLRPDEPDAPVFSPRRVNAETAKRGGPRPPGRFYSRMSLPQAIRRAARKAGVEPWQLAQLRHARATILRERFGLDVAATVLGHARPATTTIYTWTALAHAEAALKATG